MSEPWDETDDILVEHYKNWEPSEDLWRKSFSSILKSMSEDPQKYINIYGREELDRIKAELSEHLNTKRVIAASR